MDEPFASLDTILRKKMQVLVKKVCEKYDITVIFVSHNVNEILKISDKILIFNKDNKTKLMNNDESAQKKLINLESVIIESDGFEA
jgi:ABC-type nitrate/sulfonate/bicarbonate transport system ATPase subunit